MKKEHFIGIAIFLFFLSFILDFLAGRVIISITSPMDFLQPDILIRYPLSAVEVFVRSVAIAISVLIILDELEKKPFVKATILMVLIMLAGFYGIQQLGTGGNITPLAWTLSFSYSAAILVPSVFYYLIKGTIRALFRGLSGSTKKEEKEQVSTTPTSVLDPQPQEKED